MPRWGIAALRWIAVVLLWMTSGIAGEGITLACYARNELAGGNLAQVAQLAQPAPEAEIGPSNDTFTGYGDKLPEYVGKFGWMAVWLLALGLLYVWVRKDRLGLVMTVIPLSAFGVQALGTWNYAWPVCDAF